MKLDSSSFLLALLLALPVASASAAAMTEDAALAVLSSGAGLEEKAKAITELSVRGTAKSVPVLANLLADKQLHDYARNALELIPAPAASAALVASLDKLQGDLLTGVVISVGDRREKAAVPALKKMVANPKCPAAEAALSSLALIATEEAAEAIATVLKSGPSECKVAAAHAALRAAARMEKEGRSGAVLREAVKAADVPAHIKTAANPVKAASAPAKPAKTAQVSSQQDDQTESLRPREERRQKRQERRSQSKE